MKGELVGGGSSRYSNLFIVAVHYTHVNTCFVAIIDCAHVSHVILYKTIVSYCYC